METNMIRIKVIAFVGLATLSFALPTVLVASTSNAQTLGMERRHERRVMRTERRMDRRHMRQDRRTVRHMGREIRRDVRTGM